MNKNFFDTLVPRTYQEKNAKWCNITALLVSFGQGSCTAYEEQHVLLKQRILNIKEEPLSNLWDGPVLIGLDWIKVGTPPKSINSLLPKVSTYCVFHAIGKHV